MVLGNYYDKRNSIKGCECVNVIRNEFRRIVEIVSDIPYGT